MNSIATQNLPITENKTILQRVASGDSPAFEECVKQYGNLVWSIAKKFTNSEQDAEDAVQDIFIEIWQFAKRFDAIKASEVTFIAMIARRRMIDRLRRAKRQTQVSISDAIMNPNFVETGQKMQLQLEAQEATKALKCLRPEQRKLIQLAIGNGMSHREIADSTGLPLGTVKTTLRRSFQRLRNSLGVSEDFVVAA